MPVGDPVQFVREVDTGRGQECYNRVQVEGLDPGGNPEPVNKWTPRAYRDHRININDKQRTS